MTNTRTLVERLLDATSSRQDETPRHASAALCNEAADEIARLQKTVEFYAHHGHYDPGGGGGLPLVNHDRGMLARTCLGPNYAYSPSTLMIESDGE